MAAAQRTAFPAGTAIGGKKNPRLKTPAHARDRLRRGYAKTDQQAKRKHGFYVAQIGASFQDTRAWYRHPQLRGLVLGYYACLRAASQDLRPSRLLRTRCVHCGIFFLTDPRNAGRTNLRCPFGCRDRRRELRSQERAAKYYRTPKGRLKKKFLNARRRPSCHATTPPQPDPWTPVLVRYVSLILTQLEGRPVTPAEVYSLFFHIFRQLSIDQDTRTKYGPLGLLDKPP